MARIIVLDTSFLIELFQVPMDSSQGKHKEAVSIFSEALENNWDIYCPLGVLYELANHIVDVKNPQQRYALAVKFSDMVRDAWVERIPFTIVPSEVIQGEYSDLNMLPELCNSYQAYLAQQFSLTDCAIIDLVQKLQASYQARQRAWPAHIWSLHKRLKALEPNDYGHDIF